jgi:hypothetical protein
MHCVARAQFENLSSVAEIANRPWHNVVTYSHKPTCSGAIAFQLALRRPTYDRCTVGCGAAENHHTSKFGRYAWRHILESVVTSLAKKAGHRTRRGRPLGCVGSAAGQVLNEVLAAAEVVAVRFSGGAALPAVMRLCAAFNSRFCGTACAAW